MIELVIFGAVLVGYTLVSRRLVGTPLTAPMVFAVAGLLVGLGGGSIGIDVSSGEVHVTENARHLAEIALVLLLFTDAARIDLRVLRAGKSLPMRLLALGLPLTIVLGGVLALLVLGGQLELWEAFVLGAILAPTDAALGEVVVSSPKLPVRLRQALNVEAGLNDGLAVPFFTVFAALAAEEELEGRTPLLRVLFEKLGYGALVGIGIAAAGGLLLREASRRGWTTPPFEQLALLALALLAWWTAEDVGGSGLIAAFAGGLALRAVAGEVADRAADFTEDFGQLLSLIVFFSLGIAFVDAWDAVTWQMAAYAALSLTVIRMLPVAVALRGTGLRRPTVAYLAWFGPRGLASILLALILLIEYPDLPGGVPILVAVMVTVLASVFLHGATAGPLTDRYVRRNPSPAELETVPELRTRFSGAER